MVEKRTYKSFLKIQNNYFLINKFLPEVDVICLVGGKYGSTTLNNTLINNNYKSIKCHNKTDFIKSSM